MNNRPVITLENAQQQAETCLASLSQLYTSDMDLIKRYGIALDLISAFYHRVNFTDNAALAAFASGLKGTPFEGVETRLEFKDKVNEYAHRINRLNWFITQAKYFRQIIDDMKIEIHNLPERHRLLGFIDNVNDIEAKFAVLDELVLAMRDVSNSLIALNELHTKHEKMLANEKILNDLIGKINNLSRDIAAEKNIIRREQESQTLVGRLSSLASNISSFFGYSSAQRSTAAEAAATLPANRK